MTVKGSWAKEKIPDKGVEALSSEQVGTIMDFWGLELSLRLHVQNG